jgi:hypothetical protein
MLWSAAAWFLDNRLVLDRIPEANNSLLRLPSMALVFGYPLSARDVKLSKITNGAA